MDELTSLKLRLEALEKKSRAWQALGTASFLLTAALFLTGAATGGLQEVVRTKALVIADGQDRPRITMTVGDDGTASMVYSTPDMQSFGWLDGTAAGEMDFQILHPQTRKQHLQLDPGGITLYNQNPQLKQQYSGLIMNRGDGSVKMTLRTTKGDVWIAPTQGD